MRSAPARYSEAAVLGLGLLLVGACSDRSDRTTRTDTADRTAQAPAVDTGTPSTTSSGASAAPSSLTDANIVALLDEANKADSSSGAFAVNRVTNPEVKAYAKLMMGEHHALRAQGQQLAKKLGVTPEAPARMPARRKVMEIVRLTLIPTIAAASLSWATARIAFPCLVLPMK